MDTAAAIAIDDLASSIRRFPLALALAIDDIQSKYRRTVLGPIWITLGQAATIAGFSLVFSGLFRTTPREYAFFLAASLPVWTLVSTFLIEMPNAFVHTKGYLESYEIPWLTHIWRRSLNYIFVFGHQLVTLFVVMALLRIPLRAEMLLAAPALVLVLVAGFGIGVFLAVVGARYRDLQHAMSILASILFFLTPVVWRPEQLTSNTWVVALNPLYYLVGVLRDPLLGHAPDTGTWVVASAIAIVSFCAGAATFVLSRGRLYHWL
jgi:lipopolysaccharide transport system permease protein